MNVDNMLANLELVLRAVPTEVREAADEVVSENLQGAIEELLSFVDNLEALDPDAEEADEPVLAEDAIEELRRYAHKRFADLED